MQSKQYIVWLIIIIYIPVFVQCVGLLNPVVIYIYIYSFSRRFYPKRLTIEEYNKRYIIKRLYVNMCMSEKQKYSTLDTNELYKFIYSYQLFVSVCSIVRY